MEGASGSIFAIGDCTATSYAPTAQVASQQGAYLAKLFGQMAKKETLAEEKATILKKLGTTEEEKTKVASIDKQLTKLDNLRPFHYSHQGSLAYVVYRHTEVLLLMIVFYRYIGSDKAIADLPFLNGNVRITFHYTNILLTRPL